MLGYLSPPYPMSWRCGIGDTKAGKLVGTDRTGNKYYENLEDELPCMCFEKLVQMTAGLLFHSADQMGGLQGRLSGVRSVRSCPCNSEPPFLTTRIQITNRTRMARLDFIYGWQTSHRGSNSLLGGSEMGASRPPAQPNHEPWCIQDIFHVSFQEFVHLSNGADYILGSSQRSQHGIQTTLHRGHKDLHTYCT